MAKASWLQKTGELEKSLHGKRDASLQTFQSLMLISKQKRKVHYMKATTFITIATAFAAATLFAQNTPVPASPRARTVSRALTRVPAQFRGRLPSRTREDHGEHSLRHQPTGSGRVPGAEQISRDSKCQHTTSHRQSRFRRESSRERGIPVARERKPSDDARI